MFVSPWAHDVTVVSPDGSKTARLDATGEMGMRGPTRGTLTLSTGLVLEECNPSMVWSHDSRYLAIPRWDGNRQRLAVIDTSTQQVRVSNSRHAVLQLASFSGGIITGIDSPAHRPRDFSLDITSPFDVRAERQGCLAFLAFALAPGLLAALAAKL
jgi:hypothetical protein